MLDTYQYQSEAELKAHYARTRKRLNTAPVPKPVNENPARSDRSLGQARLENSLAGAETCGVASIEWVSAQDVIPPAPELPVFGGVRGMNRVATIINAASRHTGISVSDILSSRHTDRLVRPRHIAMYLSNKLTNLSFPDIGRRFGGRDHTTILSAVRKIERLIPGDQILAGDIAAVRAIAIAADPGLVVGEAA